ncbi:MAG: Do family serine endopeptidase [Bacteroidaceae bacterium]|nr:Do family serine endopeptidase [Bacteroidaceae bacterium]
MKKAIRIATSFIVLICCCIGASVITTNIVNKRNSKVIYVSEQGTPYTNPLQTSMSPASRNQPVNLTEAAEKTVHGVVHIKSTIKGKVQTYQEMPDIFEYFFGGRPRQRQYQSQPQVGYGSGVILTKDGYIVTNNHVIDNADEIQVTLNDNRVFNATLIGADANTDLALIKIDGDDFPVVPMGNSDDLKLGEWVLAVGNPFNLTSSVTAGVVSAKSRKIGIYEGGESIESFIQTDAAINMGNSGGALVNVNGELVGINAALESPTGTYAGYGFAIPTTIVKKVVTDLKEYGTVQRAMLGIMGGDVLQMRQDSRNKDTDFGDAIDGVYVSDVVDGGGALEAGIKEGDIIVSINGKKIKTMNELQETIVQYRPGDKVDVTVIRDKKQKKFEVELKNSRGNTEIVKNADMEVLGASFQEVPEQTRRQLNIGYGVQVSDIKNGLMKDAGIQRGYIILRINEQQIKTVDDVERIYKEAASSPNQELFISGVYPSGRRAIYAINLSED